MGFKETFSSPFQVSGSKLDVILILKLNCFITPRVPAVNVTKNNYFYCLRNAFIHLSWHRIYRITLYVWCAVITQIKNNTLPISAKKASLTFIISR